MDASSCPYPGCPAGPLGFLHDDQSRPLRAEPRGDLPAVPIPQYGVSRARSLDAPFERIGPDQPIAFQDSPISYEDAYLWHQDDRFHMLFNDLTGTLTGEDHAGAYATSPDGMCWELGSNPKAYSRRVRWEDGTETVQGSFERPQLLIQNGKPTHLFAATADGPGGFRRASHTWNMVVPLQGCKRTRGSVSGCPHTPAASAVRANATGASGTAPVPAARC